MNSVSLVWFVAPQPHLDTTKVCELLFYCCSVTAVVQGTKFQGLPAMAAIQPEQCSTSGIWLVTVQLLLRGHSACSCSCMWGQKLRSFLVVGVRLCVSFASSKMNAGYRFASSSNEQCFRMHPCVFCCTTTSPWHYKGLWVCLCIAAQLLLLVKDTKFQGLPAMAAMQPDFLNSVQPLVSDR